MILHRSCERHKPVVDEIVAPDRWVLLPVYGKDHPKRGLQVLRDEGLHQVEIGPVNKGFLDVRKLGGTAVHNNGQVFERGIFFYLLQTFIAVLAGHLKVKEKQVNRVQVQETHEHVSILYTRDLQRRIFLSDYSFKQHRVIPVIVSHQNMLQILVLLHVVLLKNYFPNRIPEWKNGAYWITGFPPLYCVRKKI